VVALIGHGPLPALLTPGVVQRDHTHKLNVLGMTKT
jgi:hypothetical protein